VNLTLRPGRILGLVGESGCGKSTVLLSILGLIRKPGTIDGKIMYRDTDMRNMSAGELRNIRGHEVAMIFQDPLSTLNPVFPVGEQIRESLRLHHIMGNTHLPRPLDFAQRTREQQRVLETMEEVGISPAKGRYMSYPHQFSGGMQQRALIAIALVCRPALLLADEPTTALDVTIQAQILDLMQRINEEHGTAIILVTHDLGVAAEFCDQIAVMYAGRIVERGGVDEIAEDPQHPYTRGLLACRPRIATPRRPIAPIPGNVPDLAELPEGCSFAPRCPHQRQICTQGPIPLVETSEAHISRCLIHTGYERDPQWTWADRLRKEHDA
jgi:oligopeptide/dipeptide ABC transporter ATP-binding protein